MRYANEMWGISRKGVWYRLQASFPSPRSTLNGYANNNCSAAGATERAVGCFTKETTFGAKWQKDRKFRFYQ